MIRSTIFAKPAALLLFAAMFAASPVWADGSGQNRHSQNGYNHYGSASITGSWNATINFFGSPLRVMYSFHRDGTLTESDNPGFDPNFGGDALSPAIGAWEKTGQRKGIAKYQKLAYNTAGELTLVYTVDVNVKAQRDGTLAGTLTIVVTTPDGSAVVSEFPDLPFTATRIVPLRTASEDK